MADKIPLIMGGDGLPSQMQTGDTVPIVHGGTGATSASGARTNLGAQAADATLTALAAYSATGIMVQSATDTFVGREILGTANRITVTNGNGVSGNPTVNLDTNYVGQTSINTLGVVTTGTWLADTIAVMNGGTGATSAALARQNLQVQPGVEVQAWDADLDAIAGLTSAANKLPYFTGSHTAALTDLTAFARTILDDADQAAAQATLGMGSASVVSSKAWRGHIYGLTLSNNASDPNNDIDISAGAAWDNVNDVLIEGAASTKRLDASWAVGSGNGGLFSGSKANSTWYHVFVIRRPDTGVVDYGYDTSITAVNIPANYTQYRRLGSVLTDGAGNIRAFVQSGDRFEWSTIQVDLTTASPATSRTLVTVSTPPGVVCEWIGRAIVSNSTAATNMELGSAGTTAYGLRPYVPSANNTQSDAGSLMTNTSSQLAYLASTASGWTSFVIATIGWRDLRGRA